MDPFTIAAIGGSIYSGIKGQQAQGRSEQMQKRQLEQAELEYGQRAPMRRQGMQALGQVEAPIDFGTQFHNASNPFSAAKGPPPSTASYGNWGQFTTSPDQIDSALSGVSAEDLEFYNNALNAPYLGKSGGKMRFGDPNGQQYTNDDRQHARDVVQRRYNQNLGFTGQSMNDYATQRRGMQPVGASAPAPAGPRRGMQPLGGMR